jgi:hypothetical protein
MNTRYETIRLGTFATALMVKAGMDIEKATVVSDALLEGLKPWAEKWAVGLPRPI